MRSIILLSAVSLTSLTGCGFVSGSMLGSSMFGDEEFSYGVDYETEFASAWSGDGVVCLGTLSEGVEPDMGSYQLRGRVVSDGEDNRDIGNLVPCAHDPARVMVIETASGDVYQLGYAWLDAYGYDVTPYPNVSPGQSVDLVVRQGDSEGTLSAGFALFAADGSLVYALEAGYGEPGLASGDIPELTVSSDTVVSSSDADCGVRSSLAQQFVSDSDSLTLYEGEDAGMMYDGEYYTTCNIASNEVEDCEESAGQVSWLMFR